MAARQPKPGQVGCAATPSPGLADWWGGPGQKGTQANWAGQPQMAPVLVGETPLLGCPGLGGQAAGSQGAQSGQAVPHPSPAEGWWPSGDGMKVLSFPAGMEGEAAQGDQGGGRGDEGSRRDGGSRGSCGIIQLGSPQRGHGQGEDEHSRTETLPRVVPTSSPLRPAEAAQISSFRLWHPDAAALSRYQLHPHRCRIASPGTAPHAPAEGPWASEEPHPRTLPVPGHCLSQDTGPTARESRDKSLAGLCWP